MEKAAGGTIGEPRPRLRILQLIPREASPNAPGGRVVVADPVLAALRRMVELERAGLSAEVAAARVVKELGNENGPGTVGHDQGTLVEGALRKRVEELRREAAELRADRDQWRELALTVRPALASGEPPSPWERLWAAVFGR
ncbi:MAG: hypothetical protein Kow0097_02430 [Candidatus Bipolaricaulota bacterium]